MQHLVIRNTKFKVVKVLFYVVKNFYFKDKSKKKYLHVLIKFQNKKKKYLVSRIKL